MDTLLWVLRARQELEACVSLLVRTSLLLTITQFTAYVLAAGTTMYLPQFLTDDYTPVINTWMVGSLFFTVSGMFLLYRHLILGI
jgi:hypothetical protein